jgi:hypothetical protein
MTVVRRSGLKACILNRALYFGTIKMKEHRRVNGEPEVPNKYSRV